MRTIHSFSIQACLFCLDGQVKQKQKGAKRMLLPSVEGQEGGKWIVIDSGIPHFFSSAAPFYGSLCFVVFGYRIKPASCLS